jgi:hypothetical protein
MSQVDTHILQKNRKKMSKKSGGIVIIYKNKLENCLSFIQSESQFVQWVKISNVAFDIILGCVYVPPEGSKYSNSESFDEIEKELIPLSKDSNMHSAIVGDFNAKTGTLNDFIVPDETLLDLFNLDSDDDVLSYMLDYENLENWKTILTTSKNSLRHLCFCKFFFRFLLLTTIINDLENIQARDRCTQQEIDDITNKINDVFSKTASQTFTNKPFKSKLKPNSKPWYTKKCYESRKKFHKARKHYNRFKNEINKKQLLDCSKQYKLTTNRAYNDYQLQDNLYCSEIHFKSLFQLYKPLK